MSSSSTASGCCSIFPCICGMAKNGLDYLFNKYQMSGLIIPPKCGKTTLINSVTSENTLFIDLDPEIRSEFKSEEQAKLDIPNSSLDVNRLLYSKSKEIVAQIMDLVNGTSKSIRKIVFVSSDYRLLKFIGVGHIAYMMPSDSLVQKLKASGQLVEKFDKTRQDLIERKGSKLQVFGSFDDLQKIVIAQFDASVRI